MTCFECEGGQLVPAKIQMQGERNGEAFTVWLQGLKCDNCGFQTLDSEQSAEFTRLTSDAYRSAHGLLTGKQIRSRRKRLGMNQQDFSAYLGIGSASVKRWELGQIQDKAMDELIRLKTDPDEARRNLAELQRHVPGQCVLSALPGADLAFSFGEQSWCEGNKFSIAVLALGEEVEGDACAVAA